MPTVIQNRFDGGYAEDPRTNATNECVECLNFDIYTNPSLLAPIRDSVEETIVSVGTMDEIELSDVGVCVLTTNPVFVALGRESSASSKPAFYTRTGDTGMNGSWTRQAVGSAGTVQQGSLAIYKSKAYCLNKTAATTYALERFDSAGNVTNIGTITVPTPTGSVSGGYPIPRPFVHPEDNLLYIVIGNVIATYDGSTLNSYTSILPTGMTGTSITNYGAYLAIAMRSIDSLNNSVTYLWGRDGTINTLQGVIDFGEGDLNIIENIGENIVGIVYPKLYNSSIMEARIDVRVYAGGQVQTVKSIIDENLTISGNTVNVLKLKKADKLYFATGFDETCVRSVYRNKAGRWVITKERFFANGDATTVSNINGLNAIGDYFYLAFTENGGEFKLTATNTSAAFTATSTYKTTINPSMPIGDRYKDKQLIAVQVSYTGASSGTTVVKYSVDGSAMTTVISDTNATGEQIIQATNENDGTVFRAGREFQFQVECTGGSKIKEIRYKYEVLNDAI